jgi:hypothetical protein
VNAVDIRNLARTDRDALADAVRRADEKEARRARERGAVIERVRSQGNGAASTALYELSRRHDAEDEQERFAASPEGREQQRKERERDAALAAEFMGGAKKVATDRAAAIARLNAAAIEFTASTAALYASVDFDTYVTSLARALNRSEFHDVPFLTEALRIRE